MIRIIKKEIKLDKELRSRIEWACNFAGYAPKIKERNFEND